MYEIVFTDKAERQFKRLEKETQRRITSVLERVRIRPEIYTTKLVGDPGYKLRVGDYRLILDIDKGKLILLILKVEHRRSVYKTI